ncbi:MAG: winged helix-turn-helix transcriptional regulator [Candidatus Kerfeldbacteria bacterium]|nr:winged helix-turn-helix transcriptional regulator [Candidatus Kerfeldbacteria bacterium]
MPSLERLLKALANRRRLGIVNYLKNHREATVGELADAIKLSLKATSKHLTVLSAADIIDREQRSLLVYYRLADDLSRAARTILTLL